MSGELDVEGDLAAGPSRVWDRGRRGVTRRPRLSAVAKLALQLKVLGPNPSAPAEEARLRGALTFEEGRMGVDQILAVRRSEYGSSGMPLVCGELVAR